MTRLGNIPNTMKFVNSALLGIISLSVLIVCIKISIGHAPLSDDLSMIAFSKVWSWDWINKGLADYFIVYPEYYGAQSNFIRPVSNFAYWVFGTLFTSDYPFRANTVQLLVLTYGMLITFAALNGKLLLEVQKSKTVAALGSCASLLIPTFWTTPTPTYTSFVFDGLAVTFCLLALLAIGRQQIIAMTIWLTLALMTKEIAFPVILGFSIALFMTRNVRAVIGCVFTIAVFIMIRLNGFDLHTQGVYVFDNETVTFLDFLLDKIQNILTLPFGPVFYDEIFMPSGKDLFNRSGALLVINIGIYFFSAYRIALFLKQLNRKKYAALFSSDLFQNPQGTIFLVATLSVLSAWIFDSYVGANYRYAFNFVPFLFIALGGIAITHFTKGILFSIFLLASMISSAPSIARLLEGAELETFRYQAVREFFDAVRKHENSRTILVLNDFVLAYANPRAVEILAPTSSRIERGTSLYLDNCNSYEFSKIETRITQSGTEIRVTVNLPECGRFVFESSPRLPEFTSGNTIRRNEKIRYEFLPAPDSSYASIPGWDGRNLSTVIRNKDFLYFDFLDRKWKFVAASPT